MSNNSYAKVVLDSLGPNRKRLITVEMRYWRAIHAEIMTHRDRARNAASSRAIPFYREATCPQCKGKVEKCEFCFGSGKDHKSVSEIAKIGGTPVRVFSEFQYEYAIPNCTYSYISNDPFLPEFIGTEQKGMQSGGELLKPHRGDFLQLADNGRLTMLKICKQMYDTGVHKSLINRYLEPWSYITVVMTATEWKNFFRLRVHPKAEKHFNKVAKQCQDAIEASTPQELRAGEWHTPYMQPDDREMIEAGILNGVRQDTTRPMIQIPKGYDKYDSHEVVIREVTKRVSAARCARLSYLTQDGVRSHEADLGLFESLIHPKIDEDRDDDVIHSSPLEHVGEANDDPDLRSGPFSGWLQFRKQFPNENVPG